MRDKVDAPLDFTVCYSGGLDSTYVAYLMGKRYGGNIHLVTLLHGYGQLFPNLSRRHVLDLQRLFGPGRVIHTYLKTKDLFQRILISNIFNEYKKYRSSFIWCLSCHLALVGKVIIYNLENGIPLCFLASSVGGDKYAVMSIPVTIEEKKAIYQEYGISFSTPLLDEGILKKEERRALRENGFWLGLRFRRRFLGVQPICIPCNIQHFPDTFFDIHPIFDNDLVRHFIREKRPILRAYIEEHFRSSGQDLHRCVEKLRRKNQQGSR